MSKEFCSFSNYEKIGAIYIWGRLVIWATGMAPNEFSKVRIKQSPFRIYPPMYDLLLCHTGFIPMIYNPNSTPFRIAEQFQRSQPKEDFVAVNTASGRVEVPIVVLELPTSFAEVEKSNALSKDGMPSPFFGVPGSFRLPIDLRKVFESGKSEDAVVPQNANDLNVVQATGYSDSFAFDEAFLDAVNNLPPDDNDIQDWLTNVVVDFIGAEFGGFAGVERLKVVVSSVRWNRA